MKKADKTDDFEELTNKIEQISIKSDQLKKEISALKAYCKKEFSDTDTETFGKTNDMENLTDMTEQMSAKSDQYKEQDIAVEPDPSKLVMWQVKMDKIRQEQKADLMLAVLKEHPAQDEKSLFSDDDAASGITGPLEGVENRAQVTADEDALAFDPEVIAACRRWCGPTWLTCLQDGPGIHALDRFKLHYVDSLPDTAAMLMHGLFIGGFGLGAALVMQMLAEDRNEAEKFLNDVEAEHKIVPTLTSPMPSKDIDPHPLDDAHKFDVQTPDATRYQMPHYSLCSGNGHPPPALAEHQTPDCAPLLASRFPTGLQLGLPATLDRALVDQCGDPQSSSSWSDRASDRASDHRVRPG